MFATWYFFMFLIAFSTTLSTRYEISSENVRLILIFTIFANLVVYFFIENFLAYKYCKFIFLPWVIYAIFLFNMVKNYAANNKGSKKIEIDYFFQIILLASFIFLLTLKIIKFVWSEFFYRSKFSANF